MSIHCRVARTLKGLVTSLRVGWERRPPPSKHKTRRSFPRSFSMPSSHWGGDLFSEPKTTETPSDSKMCSTDNKKEISMVTLRLVLYLIKLTKFRFLRCVLTWKKGNKFVEELHAFVATLSLGSTALFQKPYHHVWQTQLYVRGKTPERNKIVMLHADFLWITVFFPSLSHLGGGLLRWPFRPHSLTSGSMKPL